MVEKHKKLSMSREDKIFYAATYALLAVIGLCVSIPLIYILPAFLPDKVTAVYMAEPVADAIAVTCTAILFAFQFRKQLKQ